MEKILILEPRFYPAHLTKELEKYGRIENATDPREISDKIKDATVVLAWVQNRLDKRFIDAAPKVKIIATRKKEELLALSFQEGMFKVYDARSTGMISDLIKHLNKLDPTDWAETTVIYTITR